MSVKKKTPFETHLLPAAAHRLQQGLEVDGCLSDGPAAPQVVTRRENTNRIRQSWQDSVLYCFLEVHCTGPGRCLESKGKASL